MDNFVKVVKPSARSLTQGGKQEKAEDQSVNRFRPYAKSNKFERTAKDWKEKRRVEELLEPLLKDGAKPSSSALTKHLLGTLKDEANPITHSDIYSRTDHVNSMVTGHQRSDGRGNQKPYMELRGKKLREQLPDTPTKSEAKVLSGVRVYIDGYLEDTTDIEMKRIVTLHGGQVLYTASNATHILTSQQLSGSKTHKLLHKKSRVKAHVVRPEWVFGSIKAGKRLSERSYRVLNDESHKNLISMFAAGPSRNVSAEYKSDL